MPGSDLSAAVQIRRLETLGEREIGALADVLIDCVEGGASVSFMLPMSRAKAEAFWRRVAAGVAHGACILLAAVDAAGGVVGTVQVGLDQPENQPHRGDLAKMLVHRRARRLGIGAALLAAAERHALSAARHCWCSTRPRTMRSGSMCGAAGRRAARSRAMR